MTSEKAVFSDAVKDDDLIAILESLAPEELARTVAQRRRDAVEELKAHGWTLTAIADRLGVRVSTVSNWIHR